MKQYLLCGIMACLVTVIHAQTPTQKIVSQPEEVYRNSWYGEQMLVKDQTLFVVDSEYKSDKYKDCNIGYGAIHIYKKDSQGKWMRTQKLKHVGGIYADGTEAPEVLAYTGNPETLNRPSFENKLGQHISYRSNVLVASARDDDYNRLAPVLPDGKPVTAPDYLNYRINKSGSVYIYTRTSNTAPFVRLTRLFEPLPTPGGMFSEHGVATNGQYIVVKQYEKLYLFQLSNGVITQRGVFSSGLTTGSIVGLTDNNILIVSNASQTELHKLSGNTLTKTQVLTGKTRALDGNFIALTQATAIKVTEINSSGFTARTNEIAWPTSQPFIENLALKANTRLAVYDSNKKVTLYRDEYTRFVAAKCIAPSFDLQPQGSSIAFDQDNLMVSYYYQYPYEPRDSVQSRFLQCAVRRGGTIQIYPYWSLSACVSGARTSAQVGILADDLYPNPVTDQQSITYVSDAPIQRITAYSLDGRQKSVRLPIKDNQIQVGSLPTGVYQLMIQTSKGTQVRRLVKMP